MSSSPQSSGSTIAFTSGNAKLWVLLVGINQYQDQQFPALQYSFADCQALETVLLEAVREFPKKHLLTRHDFTVKPPTLETVWTDLFHIASTAKPQDTVLFYFSGHGVVDATSRQAVLCLIDTYSEALLDTGLKISELLHLLGSCEARQQIVWFDVCHSSELVIQSEKENASASIVSTEITTEIVKLLQAQTAQRKGFYALLSCDQKQCSWKFPELGHGLFTYYLIRGLEGNAAGSKGVISADGLYRYVSRETVKFIEQKNQQLRLLNEQKRQNGDHLLDPEYSPQTPKRIFDGVEDLVLGLSPQKGFEHFSQVLPQPPTISSDVPLINLPANSSIATPTLETELPVASAVSAVPQWYRLLSMGAAGSVILSIIGTTIYFPRLLPASNPTNSVVAQNQSCNRKVELEQPANPVIDPQVLLVSCNVDSIWQPRRAKLLPAGNPVWAIGFTPDQQRLVTAGGQVGEIWNLSNQQQIHTLGGHLDWVYDVAISPNGQMLASASADNTIRLWNSQTGALLRVLEGHTAAIWSVAFSPDGKMLASASADKTVKLWNLATGAMERTLAGHTDWVFSVAFSPNQPVLASSSKDKTIKLWDLQTGKLWRTFAGHNDAVRAITFAPDGKFLASASWDNTVKIWQVTSGEILKTFGGHTNRVVAVTFSPDGKTLASSSIDRTVKLWNMTNSSPIGTLYGHADWVLSVTFSPDGKMLASGSRDKTLILWQQ